MIEALQQVETWTVIWTVLIGVCSTLSVLCGLAGIVQHGRRPETREDESSDSGRAEERDRAREARVAEMREWDRRYAEDQVTAQLERARRPGGRM